MATTITYDDGILYVKAKAQKGVLERVCIRRVSVPQTTRPGATVQPVYVDTLNGRWLPGELVDEATAKSLAEAYYTARLEALS